MANENIKKFEEMLKAEPELQAKLEKLNEAFEGDRADESAFLEATVCKAAEEVGLPFSVEEAQDFFGERELTDAELEGVAGGGCGQCAWAIGG